MAACPKCDGFTERMNLGAPNEYRDIARQLSQFVNEGTFVLVHADCPLQELLGEVWPGDVIVHIFKCSSCGREFKLAADTYHGNASWHAL